MKKSKINFPQTFDKIRKRLPDKIQCVVCLEEFETYAKGKDKFIHGIISPNLVIGRLTTDNPYPLACKSCSQKVLRSIGIIPEKDDEKVFPQVLSKAMSVDKFIKSMKTNARTTWQIHYKNKTIKYSKKEFDKLLDIACKNYLKKYVYVRYTIKQLKARLRTHKVHPLDYE